MYIEYGPCKNLSTKLQTVRVLIKKSLHVNVAFYNRMLSRRRLQTLWKPSIYIFFQNVFTPENLHIYVYYAPYLE